MEAMAQRPTVQEWLGKDGFASRRGSEGVQLDVDRPALHSYYTRELCI